MANASNTLDPRAVARRSPIYRALAAAGARFASFGDAVAAATYDETPEAEHEALRELGLADLSPLPRTGFKGRDMAGWLREQGVAIDEISNRAYPCGRNSLAARLSPGEVLILGGADGSDDLWQRLEAAWTPDAGIFFPVPRREGTFWFRVSGEKAPSMFAKLCGVDLRPGSFENLSVAQTSVARINAILVRDDIGGVVSYHLLGDVASAGSMWSYLSDAMTEFSGRYVGIEALVSLADEPAP